MRRTEVIPPGLAWLTVFVPALSYFLATRFSSLHNGGTSLGTAITTRVDSFKLKDVFYLQQGDIELQYPLVLIDDSFSDVVASTWRHDAELGRGYLLLSQAHLQGRIWRWERGGGPIPIGRTLAMDPSGCRSKHDCNKGRNGSGGLAIDFYKHDEFRQGSLVVAEWGEGRIVKVEEETGARTPLVITVPDACKHASARPRRVERPVHMLFTPTGDLLFLESTTDCSTLMRLNQAVHVPPLDSAMMSRVAHKWNETHHDHTIDVLLKEPVLGSMALDSKGEGLYVTAKRDDDDGVLLIHVSLLEDDNDYDDEEDNASTRETATVAMNLTEALANITEPPKAMAVDESGNVFLAVSDGVLVLKNGKLVLGKVASPTPITSLTLGEDKYLYVTTSSQLLRIRVRHGPPKPRTDQVKKKRSTVKS